MNCQECEQFFTQIISKFSHDKASFSVDFNTENASVLPKYFLTQYIVQNKTRQFPILVDYV